LRFASESDESNINDNFIRYPETGFSLAEKQTVSPKLELKTVSVSTNGSLYSLSVKGKVFPYTLPSVGPGADPGVQAVSLQVT